MITYQEESFADSFEEMKHLFDAHWSEIAMYKDKFKLNPDYDKYCTLESIGCLHTVTARNESGIIGYFLSFIQPHMHYMDCLTAINDIVFIHPDHRKGLVGYKLFKVAEKLIKAKGVHVMVINSKVKQDFEPIMTKLGFDRFEYSYSKYIGDS